MSEISNENKAVNLEDLGTATTEIKRDILLGTIFNRRSYL